MSDHDDQVESRRREILEAFGSLSVLNHFESLGVGEGASEQEIKQAYLQKVKKFHPDQFGDSRFADLADRIIAIFTRVQGAYEVLRNPESRQSYEILLRRRRATDDGPQTQNIDTLDNARMVGQAIHRAKALIAGDKFWEAVQILSEVIPKIFGREQRARARLLLARAYIQNPNWMQKGEELLQAVIKDDPRSADAHHLLGTIYKEAGLTRRAGSMFRKALELRPGGQEKLKVVLQLAGLTANTHHLLQAVENELAAQVRQQMHDAVERAQRVCEKGEPDEAREYLDLMQRIARQLEEVGQMLLKQLAVDLRSLLRMLERKLTAEEGKQVLLALDRAEDLRYGGPSDELARCIVELRVVRRWLEELRPN